MLLVLACVVPIAAEAMEPSPGDTPPLGEWSRGCDPAFRLAAMPDAWGFSTKAGPLTILARVAVDFERLPESAYEVRTDERSGERVYHLSGYRFMALEAVVRPAGEARELVRIPGEYSVSSGKEPVVFQWDGRDARGRPVPPGTYEIEVRGRFVPSWVGLRPGDGFGYGDLDGWSVVAEACRRPMVVEVVERAPEAGPGRGTSCAPPPADYYATVDATSPSALRSSLHDVIDDHTRYPYSSTSTDTWDVLNDADENPSDPSTVLDIYWNHAYADGCSSGCDWDREHTWAKSYGFPDESGDGRTPYTDCFNLRAAYPSYNSSRGNLPHDECVSGCTEKPTEANNGFGGGPDDVNLRSGSSVPSGSTPTADDTWETWDHRKGDVARSVLYMDIRYEGDSGVYGSEPDLVATSDRSLMLSGSSYQATAYHGVLSTLVSWSQADPPDADEERRNDQVWCYQGNRNPFVDHPEWVECLYLGQCVGGPTFGGIVSADDVDPCAATGVALTWDAPSDWGDDCTSGCERGYRVYRDGAEVTSGGCAGPLAVGVESCTDDGGTTDVTYTYTVKAFNDDGGASDGGVSVDAADADDDGTPPSIASGPSAAAGSHELTVSWTTDEPGDSRLEWGTSPGGPYDNVVSDGALTTDHQLTANRLEPGTTYVYRVCSTDGCGNGPACSAEQTVDTATGGCDPGDDTPVFINELHYDNDGTDTGELIEIAGPAGTDLGAGWRIELYSAGTGQRYDDDALSGTIDDENNGFGALAFSYPTNGIQNGSPDGLALIDDTGAVAQFLCYEGTFTPTDGRAAGMTCTDIGVEESGSTAIGDSLQLTGTGFVAEDFTWTGPTADSSGDVNAGQTFQCSGAAVDPVVHLTATSTDGQNKLEWVNPTSADYAATRIVYRTDGFPASATDGTLLIEDGAAGSGGSDSTVHTGLTNGQTYYYSAFAGSSGGTYSDGATVAGTPFDMSGAEKWRYATGASALAPAGILPGALGTGAVYAGSNDRTLHGMNATSAGGDWPSGGTFAWTPFAMNAPAQHRPPVVPLAAGPRVFLASEDGHAYCVDAETGAQAWRSSSLGTMLQANPSGLFSDLVAGAPDLVVVGTRDAGTANTLYALDAATGAVLTDLSFTNAAGQGGDGSGIGIITGTMVDYATDRAVFTSRDLSGGSDDTVWCVDLGGSAVQLVWSAALGDIDGAPVPDGGRVYVGTNAGQVAALDASTGTVAWTHGVADGPVKGHVWPRYGTDDLVFATTTTVWSIRDDDTGATPLWDTDDVPSPSVPLLIAGTDLVLVGGGDGVLYQLDAGTGAVTGSVALSDGALGAPSYDNVNGLVQVGAEDGVVHAVSVPLS